MSRCSLLFAAAPVAAAALLLAGCSSGTDTATTPSVTFAPDASTTPGMAGMSGMPDMPGMSMTPSSAAATSAQGSVPSVQGATTVEITNFAFAPLSVTIPVGTTLTWTNRDEEPHTVVANDGSFHSPGMDSGGTYSFTFQDAGSFDYVCSIHPFMHGTVVVTK